jgi:hypothetical protein
MQNSGSHSPIRNNSLKSNNDNQNRFWLLSLLGTFLRAFGSTLFELLLLGFTTFFPSYLFKITPLPILFVQIATLSLSVSFLQGCSSSGYLSRFKTKSSNIPPWLSGMLAAVPLNMFVLAYFVLYNRNPQLDQVHIKHVFLFTAFVILFNFIFGILGSQKYHKALQQNRFKWAENLFYFSAIATFVSWIMIFLIMIFVLKLNISARFPI